MPYKKRIATMKKRIFLYSGEGTKSSESRFTLVRQSQHWPEIERILSTKLNLDLEKIWNEEIDRHRCPYSPLLTVVAQICLSDIWSRWGYKPDAVIGHSIGELSAAWQAGLYSLEKILLLTYRIGEITSKLDGVMLHGSLTDRQIEDLPVNLSSYNFVDGARTHVTLSGYADEMSAFISDHPEFVQMRLPQPWHHPDYRRYIDDMDAVPSRKAEEIKFVSGTTTGFEDRLADDHWKKWIVKPVDFVRSMEAIKKEYSECQLEIIEIGFHPVLDKCCDIFDDYIHVSSMFRGEDEIKWILFQRRRLDPQPFAEKLQQSIAGYKPDIDFKTSLAYQGFTSLKFLEFSVFLQPFFPSLAPQDFYRYKTLNQLMDNFGIDNPVDVPVKSKFEKNEVVIAGMSCRLPSAVENLTQFWQMLLSKKDQINLNPGRGNAEAGYLDDTVTRFDHKYFNISEVEAQTMDPQQILALELTEMLWKDAGINPEELNKKRIGVYLGVWNQEYLGDINSVYYPTGTNPSIIASRISYQYDLRGPSWVSNTACSSSLVAVHYACKDIEDGRVDYAIAGGVNMLLGNTFTDKMRKSGFLSTDNRCKAFDDSADGYVRAEGGGLVLLVNKELVDTYYAQVIGSAINQNGGRAQVITAPHPEAQEELILDACRDAAIAPQDISYIECHGTGTKIGDPIEISAIQNTIARDREDTCHVGSVKSNLGHLESAAGIAGLIKSVLILQNGVVPPNLHFNRPNQFIDFDTYHLNVVAEETAVDKQINIGVSSFGFGGANAHVVVKGVADDVRKAVENLEIPFDRTNAPPLKDYFQIDGPSDSQAGAAPAADGEPADVGSTIKTLFTDLTSIEDIDPDLELIEQGLDSMSATELINSLEREFKIELDPDVLFDYPLLEQIVELIEKKLDKKPGGESSESYQSEELAGLAN